MGALPIHLFRLFCCSTLEVSHIMRYINLLTYLLRMYRLATVHNITDRQTDRTDDIIMPIVACSAVG